MNLMNPHLSTSLDYRLVKAYMAQVYTVSKHIVEGRHECHVLALYGHLMHFL